MKSWSLAALLLLGNLCTASVFAQNPDPLDIRACTAIVSDAMRLTCYDHATHRDRSDAQKEADAKIRTNGVFSQVRADARTEAASPEEAAPPSRSLLDSRWELMPESKLGTFNLRSFQPVYVMPVFATSKQNNEPGSPNPANSATERQHLDNIEAKFQLSLKTKIWQGVFGDVGDLWMGYTQSSRWQLYNKKESRPFRESDYEPEAMLVFATNYHAFGWDGRLLGIGIDHQSNGRSDPYSRSWNRIVANVGFERENWTVMLRP
ncbi:MAG: phospholipase A, partial [Dokdonella sp.]